ncbi:hypothetical protein [Inediibacterium massiliense]|uniref:hypothetical protein n=1 Tax=Inediibacterium massiliense TaxID=1658111 RepID=UPI0006B54E6B|nr:hypothetical protein [Inediibacterium massiliense]
MNILEKQYLSLKAGELSMKDFEIWVYKEGQLEKFINHDDYIDLMSLDYKSKFIKDEIEKIIDKYIDYPKYYKNKVITMLDRVLDQHEQTGEILRKFYNMYCHGCAFFQDLGIQYGLMCEVPTDVNSWDDLNTNQKRLLVNSFYPGINDFAIEIRKLIENGTIKILRYDERNLKYIVIDERFIDTSA